MKSKWRKRLFTFITAAMAGLLMSHGLPELAADLNAVMVTADGGNTVNFTTSMAEANDSNLVYVDIKAEGNPHQKVTVIYRTSSGTAIENVDYVGVHNSVDMDLGILGQTTYRVAIKCLDDASTREKLRVYDSNETYGRYFNLHLESVTNASIGQVRQCKCYLPYDYKVAATTGLKNEVTNRKIAYLNDYRDMISKYHKGDNDISGKENWRTWKEGVSFNNETTKRWVNTYINPGFASAYGSYVIKNIDDDKIHSTSNIYMLSGNKEFMEKYSRSSSCPGLSLFYEIEPCTSGGHRIDGKAMYYISQNINPWKQRDELVDLEELHVVSKDRRRIYWIQKESAWYSGANSIYDSMFYKTDPYNGILDYGLSIFNNNKSWDREVHDIWLFLTLYDSTAPKIVSQYSEYDPISQAVRVYLRFNEPVFASKGQEIYVKINGKNSFLKAEYKEGNYSDTLVYQIPYNEVPHDKKITSITYQLPSEDIVDMAYNLDAYKNISNNYLKTTEDYISTNITGGGIDLCAPQLAIDLAVSNSPKSIYNLMLSANGKGATSFDTGTVYYTWKKEVHMDQSTSPSSYDHSHVLTSEEQGSFGVTLAKTDQTPSGDYYLHALAISQYGITANNVFGPYKLDGDAPVIKQLDPSVDLLRRKTYLLEVQNKPMNTSIQTITAFAKYKNSDGVDTVGSLDLVADSEPISSLGQRVYKDTSQAGKFTLEYRSNIDESDTTIPQDDFILGLMGTRSRLPVEIYFEVLDAAGNKAKSSSISTVYDKRTLFETEYAIPATYHLDDSMSADLLSTDVYDISSATGNDGITITLKEDASKQLVDDGAVFSMVVNGEQTFASTSENKYAVTLKGLKAGHYTAVGTLTGTAGGTEVDMVSKSYSFYLTKGMQDKTINKENANGNLVLTNHVYQLEEARYYYFKSTDNSVGSFLYGATINPDTGKYEGGSASPAFSSSLEAKKYVKFMEYQDLELISITDTIASLLNSSTGSTVYVKAAKETRNAIEGQLWIRYKKSTWTASMGANGWAFYYYGEGKVESGININGLSNNLSSAIDAVTNRIIGEGGDAFLVGEDNTDRITSAPRLGESQMHVGLETAEQTMSGNVYLSNPTYQGDADLYQNNVVINSTAYPLATNLALKISSATTLFFKPASNPSAAWTRIEAEDGTLLKNALAGQASDLYLIREYGDEGVSEFTVYLDRSLPQLSIVIDPDSAATPVILDGSITEISGREVKLDRLEGEVDPEAYVAIYSYPNRSLITVLYGDDIRDYSLSDGNYYLQVGDRSGNVVTYSVWTSTVPMGIEVEENEAKTLVYIRVSNRADNEIYSYEVYLNETLIDTEYAPYKTYRGAGIYRFEIVDIYGNRETRTITHENPSPEMTWYYLNDNGGYSLYNEDNPVKMVLVDDSSSSRTTYVHSSTMVRILFNTAYQNDDVEFELLDIPGEAYTYNPSTGLLSINTLSNWRLRVWYKGQPENDHLYIFSVDADAPEISATFIGTGFAPYVVYDDNGNVLFTSTFDSLNTDQYNENDRVTLDTLSYEAGAQTTFTFHSGDVICGNHIVLVLSDVSEIRSTEVTCNGVPVKVQLDEEGNLVLNGLGTYRVTVTDKLGNVATFIFTNVDANISSATLDNMVLTQDQLTYGHEAFDICTDYSGTSTILVKIGDKSYTYEFRYDDNVLTFGQYYIRIETGKDDEDHDISIKVAEYVQTPGFILNTVDEVTNPNVWYPAVMDDNFSIYAMIDDQGKAHYRVIANGTNEVYTEFRYSVGSAHAPNRYIAALSKESPTLDLLTDGEPVEKVANLECIYIAGDLTIKTDTISENIVTIVYSYSETQVFKEPITLYADGQWVQELLGKENGFYRIIVTNKYGNSTVYLISKIHSFASIVNIHCLDGSTVTFTGNNGTICSNHSIELIVFSTEVEFEVDGVRVIGFIDGGTTTLTLTREGKHEVRVVSANGVFELFSFEIENDETFLFEDEWVIGYNEKALLADKYYTNTFCSIVVEEDSDVVFVDMVINDDRHVVLYDNITEDKKTDKGSLVEAIGRYGVGKYVIGFRNKYGDLQTHTVYYNNIPSIILTRSIASDPNVRQTYDLGLAIQQGFYTNYIMYFSTTSTTYEFTIDGKEYRLDEPKSLEFSNIGGKGSFEYTVTYLDEYGNFVQFQAILSRLEVKFDTSSMNTITVGNTLYTRDDVSITFEQGLKATLSIDGGEAKDYFSGEEHYADGEYTFVVRDIAGNNVSFVIVHKSVNHYSLTTSNTGEDVIDGGVVNDSNVLFASSDGSKIKYVVRNGELIPEYNSNTFSATGHYELIIEDSIGNRSYEEFTILNNALIAFDYNAPFEYQISEIWKVNDRDGSRTMITVTDPKKLHLDQDGDYLIVVTSTKTASSFNFTVAIDNTLPSAVLNGVSDGGVTGRDVTLSGTKSGDVIKVYKDGELISTTIITYSTDAPKITSGGSYRIVITNVQGASIEYNFVRKSIANVPASIFIIAFSVLLITAVGIGLAYHTKLKTDD